MVAFCLGLCSTLLGLRPVLPCYVANGSSSLWYVDYCRFVPCIWRAISSEDANINPRFVSTFYFSSFLPRHTPLQSQSKPIQTNPRLYQPKPPTRSSTIPIGPQYPIQLQKQPRHDLQRIHLLILFSSRHPCHPQLLLLLHSFYDLHQVHHHHRRQHVIHQRLICVQLWDRHP